MIGIGVSGSTRPAYNETTAGKLHKVGMDILVYTPERLAECMAEARSLVPGARGLIKVFAADLPPSRAIARSRAALDGSVRAIDGPMRNVGIAPDALS
jgi:hypothetical protein